MNYRRNLLCTVAATGLAIVCANPALAATPATAAGSTITNTVSVSYNVGTVAQTAKTASDAFIVDRKINLTVAEVGTTTTSVSPGQTGAVTTFTVTNNSNATLDFTLAVAQQSGGAGAHSNIDTFDATAVSIYVDTGTTNVGVFGPEDTLVTYLDELAPEATRTVFVIASIPLGQTTGAVAAVTLTATAKEGGTAGSVGAGLTETTGANTASMDTVFADVAGATDGLRDAAHSAKDDYTVSAAALTVLKTSKVISDPFNGTTDPKPIPGATIEYCIQVINAAGSATATSVAISDPLPGTVAYDTTYGTYIDGTVTSGACNTDGTSATGTYDGTSTVSKTIASIAASETKTLRFRATIR